MRFPSLHKLHAQKYKTSLSHRFMQCSGKPGRWVIFHIPFCAVSARGATRSGACQPGFRNFNSRPCERGDFKSSQSEMTDSPFQFTPLREGRPGENTDLASYEAISIHAPARGATANYLLEPLDKLIFQFTPLREGRPCPGGTHKITPKHFNSRPCERGDEKLREKNKHLGYFNSRPCERGDVDRMLSTINNANFNSRPCERGDLGRLRRAEPPSYFNSRPCERGDGILGVLQSNQIYFNSRPCERGDALQSCFFPCLWLFQFTPLREGRPDCPQGEDQAEEISIHAPARGATFRVKDEPKPIGFQFTPLREGRPLREVHRLPYQSKFQFTPLREGRQDPEHRETGNLYFNSRPCERGDCETGGKGR